MVTVQSVGKWDSGKDGVEADRGFQLERCRGRWSGWGGQCAFFRRVKEDQQAIASTAPKKKILGPTMTGKERLEVSFGETGENSADGERGKSSAVLGVENPRGL